MTNHGPGSSGGDDGLSSLSVTPTVVSLAPVAPSQSLADRPPWEAPKNDAQGKRQRLRLYVPTAATTMSLGDTDARNGQYNGFGVHTVGHVVYSAMGKTAHGSRLKFESQDNMVIQSVDGAMFVGSKNLTALVSGEELMVGGAAGVLVHGGSMLDMSIPHQDSRTGHVPDLAKAWEHPEHSYHMVKAAWEFFDAAVCGFEVANNALHLQIGRMRHTHKATTTLKLLTPLLGSIFGVGAGVFGGFQGYTGTVVHGDSGIIVGSPGFTSFYGGLSSTFGSVGGIFTATSWFELFGRDTAELVSWRALTVESKNATEIVAGENVVLTSRNDRASVEAKNISVGGLSSAGPQVETESAAIGAEKVAVFQSDDAVVAGKKAVGLSGEKVTFGATKHVAVSSKKHVVWGVNKSQVSVKNGEILFGLFTSALDAPPSREAYPAKSDPHHFAGKAAKCLKSRAEEADGYAKKSSPPSAAGSVVQLTSSSIKVIVKGYEYSGDAVKWSFPNMTVLK